MKKNKPEKIWVIGYFHIRRHSRVLYLPLDPVVTRLHDLRKGDIVKAALLEVIKAPRDQEDEGEPE